MAIIFKLGVAHSQFLTRPPCGIKPPGKPPTGICPQCFKCGTQQCAPILPHCGASPPWGNATLQNFYCTCCCFSHWYTITELLVRSESGQPLKQKVNYSGFFFNFENIECIFRKWLKNTNHYWKDELRTENYTAHNYQIWRKISATNQQKIQNFR